MSFTGSVDGIYVGKIAKTTMLGFSRLAIFEGKKIPGGPNIGYSKKPVLGVSKDT